MEHWWDDDDRVEPSTVLRDNPVTVFLCLPPSPCALAGLGSNPGLHCERLVTSCLSYGMAQEENVEYSTL
jgi:hypothetical protein